jgi:hypothetical protein
MYLMFINGKEFLTVRDMAEKLGKKASAIKTLLFRYGFEPLSRDALYPMEAFNAIKDAPGKGRPRKVPPVPEPPAKPVAKRKK